MKRLIPFVAILAFAASSGAATAPVPQQLEGKWTNPKKSVVLAVSTCGKAYCGKVAWASDKARTDASKGGTPNLIGTELISGFVPDGRGGWKGRIFLPKQNIRAGGTIRMVGRDTLLVKGCALAGMSCKEQSWRRID